MAKIELLKVEFLISTDDETNRELIASKLPPDYSSRTIPWLCLVQRVVEHGGVAFSRRQRIAERGSSRLPSLMVESQLNFGGWWWWFGGVGGGCGP